MLIIFTKHGLCGVVVEHAYGNEMFVVTIIIFVTGKYLPVIFVTYRYVIKLIFSAEIIHYRLQKLSINYIIVKVCIKLFFG